MTLSNLTYANNCQDRLVKKLKEHGWSENDIRHIMQKEDTLEQLNVIVEYLGYWKDMKGFVNKQTDRMQELLLKLKGLGY
jgi:hypothetical protein